MKKYIISILAALPLAIFAASSTPQGFTDDLEAAIKNAKASGKLVYVCFSGSDWCGYCIKLDKDVFKKAEFAASLKDDFELVFIDCPRNMELLSEGAKKRNRPLAKKYEIKGFPTMVVIDPQDGEEVTRGPAFRSKGVNEYVEFLKGIREHKDEIRRSSQLENTFLKPLTDRYEALFGELNVECGKLIDAEMKKPENAGKSRESMKGVAMSAVKGLLPKFIKLKEEAQAKAKEAPEEVRGKIDGFVKQLAAWIEKVEQTVQ